MKKAAMKMCMSFIALIWATLMSQAAYGQQTQVNTLLGNIAVELKDSLNATSPDGWRKRYDSARYIIRGPLPRALAGGGQATYDPICGFSQELETALSEGRLSASPEEREARRAELASLQQEFCQMAQPSQSCCGQTAATATLPPAAEEGQATPVYQPSPPRQPVQAPVRSYQTGPGAGAYAEDVDDALVEELYSNSYVPPDQVLSSLTGGMGGDVMPSGLSGGMSIPLPGGLGNIIVSTSGLGLDALSGGMAGGGGIDPTMLKDLISYEGYKTQKTLLESQLLTLESLYNDCTTDACRTDLQNQFVIADGQLADIQNKIDETKDKLPPPLQYRMRGAPGLQQMLKDARNKDTIKNLLNANKERDKKKIKQGLLKDGSLKKMAEGWKRMTDPGKRGDFLKQIKEKLNDKQQAGLLNMLSHEKDPAKKAQLKQSLDLLKNSNKLTKLANAMRTETNPARQAALKNQLQKLMQSGKSKIPLHGGIGSQQKPPLPSGPFTTSLSGRKPRLDSGNRFQPLVPAKKLPSPLASLQQPVPGSGQLGNSGLQPANNAGSAGQGASALQPWKRSGQLKRNKPIQTLSSINPALQQNLQPRAPKPHAGKINQAIAPNVKPVGTGVVKPVWKKPVGPTTVYQKPQRTAAVWQSPRPLPTTTLRMQSGAASGGAFMGGTRGAFMGGGRRRR